MKLRELGSFDVVHEGLAWPWLAFEPRGRGFAFCASDRTIATRWLRGDAPASGIEEGPTFTLPDGIVVSTLRGFAVDPDASLLVIVAGGAASGASSFALITCDARGEVKRTPFGDLARGFEPCALVFDRKTSRVWISAESASETAVLFVDATTHALLGTATSAAFPRPSNHELYVHPVDDAVLLVAACGEEGTFARVVGWSGEAVERIATSLDEGGIAAGFVGFTNHGAHVHLVEADELRTHAWPTLHELASVELADDFVSSFSGAVLNGLVHVDGQHADDGDDAVLRFDRAALFGSLATLPVPAGMWAGRLGDDVLVTVEAKGAPARGEILRISPEGTPVHASSTIN